MVDKEDLYMTAKKLCLCTEAFFNNRLDGEGLTASQCYLLYYIWFYHPKGTFITSLHKELGLSKATISGSLKRLRKKGYLVVEACNADERQKKLIPTDKLAGISEDLRTVIENAENFIYRELSEPERELLLKLEQKALEGALGHRERNR